VLATLQKELLAKYPGLVIAGAHDGYYDDADSDAIAAEIRGSGADMLFLGMTSPKKEIFLARFGDNLDVPILHGVGGSFDIFAGITKRAPRLWQVMGCEWLYRVIQEPGRLWYRYLTTNTTFLWLTLRELFRPLHEYRKTTGAARVDIAP
jgi:N-acetylglucosaminyldiphosphoundecaprenol N-acetyl-beta-D-mannosaminyltransferase